MNVENLNRPYPRKVLIVEDHPMMRRGLKQFLEQEGNFKVCGEASNASEALTEMERSRPDVVLLDISLEGRSGLDLLKDLQARFRETPVLVHSMHDDAIFAERALSVGAKGYVLKRETGERLLDAIQQVLKGEIFVGDVKRRSKAQRNFSGSGQTAVGSLSCREFEVFRLVGQGCSNRKIAEQLHVSVKTVEAHRENIRRKLKVNGSTELNLLAARWVASEQS